MIEYDRITVYALNAAFSFRNVNYDVNTHGSLVIYQGSEQHVVVGRFTMPYALTINDFINNVNVSKIK